MSKFCSTSPRRSAAFRLAVLYCLIAGPAACSQHETSPKYQVTSDETTVTVTPNDLDIEPAIFSRPGSHMLIKQPTRGQFPAGMCVVRVEAFKNDAGERRLRILPLPSQHAIYWNHLFDSLPPLREVVFLGGSGIDPRGCHIEEILKASAARNCELCLIYSRVETTEADAEYVGVIWAARAHKALASVRAPVVLPIDMEEDMRGKPGCDASIAEADFRSEQDLRRMVRDLTWDLARQDLEAASKEQNPWENYVPPLPDFDRYRYPGMERPTPYNSPPRRERDRRGADAGGEENDKDADGEAGKTAVAGDPEKIDE